MTPAGKTKRSGTPSLLVKILALIAVSILFLLRGWAIGAVVAGLLFGLVLGYEQQFASHVEVRRGLPDGSGRRLLGAVGRLVLHRRRAGRRHPDRRPRPRGELPRRGEAPHAVRRCGRRSPRTMLPF